MGALIPNVTGHRFQPRFADAEGAVTFLPGKIGQRREGLVNPLGGIPFDVLSDLAGRERRRRHDQGVNMVVDAANLQRRQLVFARHTAHIFPYALLNLRLDPGAAIFRAKDDMIEERRVSVCHVIPYKIRRPARRGVYSPGSGHS